MVIKIELRKKVIYYKGIFDNSTPVVGNYYQIWSVLYRANESEQPVGRMCSFRSFSFTVSTCRFPWCIVVPACLWLVYGLYKRVSVVMKHSSFAQLLWKVNQTLTDFEPLPLNTFSAFPPHLGSSSCPNPTGLKGSRFYISVTVFQPDRSKTCTSLRTKNVS